jgi:hypothetical protein
MRLAKTNEPMTALSNGNVKPINEGIEVGAPSIARVSTQKILDAFQSSDAEPDDKC